MLFLDIVSACLYAKANGGKVRCSVVSGAFMFIVKEN
jgi:hypothetical protein